MDNEKTAPVNEELLRTREELAAVKQELKDKVRELEQQTRIFDTTLSAIADFAYIFNRDGRFLYSNRALAQLLGLSLEQMVGKNFHELPYPEELATKLQSQIEHVFKTGETLVDETPYTNPAGETGYYEYIFRPVPSADGKAIEFVAGSTRDITRRKQAEDEIKAAETRLWTLVQTAPLGVYLIDQDFRLRQVNATALPIFAGIPDHIGKNFDEIIHLLWPKEFANEIVARFSHTLESGEPLFVPEVAEKRADSGKLEYYEWQINRISLPDGGYGVVCYFRDITAYVLAREKVAAAEAKTRESLAERHDQLQGLVDQRTVELKNTIGDLQAFSYSVSHDMRAPLRAMQGFSQALLEDYADKLDENGKDYLGRIVRAATRLDLLVRDVLSYSTVANNEIELKPVDLTALLEEIRSNDSEFQEPKATVKIEGTLPPVLAHQAFLPQILTNLLGNAVKFQKPGAKPVIGISAERFNDKVRIWIKDNGIGIDPANHTRIFGVFARIDPEDAYAGTGIGLAIVKKAVSRMGGEVGLESSLNQGSCFWFTLPSGKT